MMHSVSPDPTRALSNSGQVPSSVLQLGLDIIICIWGKGTLHMGQGEGHGRAG